MSRVRVLLASLPALVVGLLAAPPAARAWQTHLQNRYANFVSDVAIGSDGSIVAGGISDFVNYVGRSFVVKLAVDGTVVWRVNVDGYSSRAETIQVDAPGDVLVGGLAGGQDEDDLGHFVAVKLAAATGAEIWRYEDPDAVAGRPARAGAGDVVAGVEEAIFDPVNEGYTVRTFCRKLAGADGSVQWDHEGCGEVYAVDADGDALAADFRDVQRIAASAVAFDPGGDVVARGRLGAGFSGSAPIVLKLGARNGHRVWQATLHGDGGPNALALDTTGTIAVAGNSFLPGDDPEPSEFAVARLGRDGDGATDPPRVY